MPPILAVVCCFVTAVTIGHAIPVRGRVADATGATALAGATVAVLRSADSSVVTGAVADAGGRFVVPVTEPSVVLRIGMPGYRAHVVVVDDRGAAVDTIDLGTVLLERVTTDAVVVEAQRQQVILQGGHMIVAVAETPTANAGTAIDVLRQVPAVSVDQDGGVSLRGSEGVHILIDGKPIEAYGPARQILASLPSQAIDVVDIVKNPGARYDAEGQAGIINIVMKKQRNDGVNGMVTLAGGLLDNYTMAASANARYNDVNVFGSGDVQSSRQRRFRRAAATFDDGTTLLREGTSSYRNLGGGGRLGVDLTVGDDHTISASADLRTSDGVNQDPFTNTTTVAAGGVSTTRYSVMDQEGGGPFVNTGLTLGYVYRIDASNHRLTTDVTWVRSRFDITGTNVVRPTDRDGASVEGPIIGRRSRTWGTSSWLQAQSDYSLPLNEDHAVETGVKATLQGIDSRFDLAILDAGSDSYSRDAARSNAALHQDDVYAAYVNWRGRFGSLSIEAGLRGEHTSNRFTSVYTPDLGFQRAFGNLFPSMSLAVALGATEQVQLSYSRRIQRPDGQMLNPYLDVSDSLNWRTGNPRLLPEYTDAVEVAYLQHLPWGMVQVDVFHHTTVNMINLRVREAVAPSVILEKPYNFGRGMSAGVGLFTTFDPTPWMQGRLAYNAFHQEAGGTFNGQDYRSTGFGWSSSAVLQIQLPFAMSAQVQGSYNGPQVIPQGRRMEFAMLSFALNHRMLGDQLVLGLNWTDCLNTARFGGAVTGPGFSTDLLNRRDFSLLSLNLSYTINGYRARPQKEGGGSAPVEVGGNGV